MCLSCLRNWDRGKVPFETHNASHNVLTGNSSETILSMVSILISKDELTRQGEDCKILIIFFCRRYFLSNSRKTFMLTKSANLICGSKSSHAIEMTAFCLLCFYAIAFFIQSKQIKIFSENVYRHSRPAMA